MLLKVNRTFSNVCGRELKQGEILDACLNQDGSIYLSHKNMVISKVLIEENCTVEPQHNDAYCPKCNSINTGHKSSIGYILIMIACLSWLFIPLPLIVVIICTIIGICLIFGKPRCDKCGGKL